MPSSLKHWLKRAGIVALALGVAAGGTVFWTELPCSDPSCARQRYTLFVELDSFQGIDPVPLEVSIGEDEVVSATNIMASGGIDLQIEPDDTQLPYDPQSGPLDRADLYQYSLAWRNLAVPSRADGQIYAMVTPAIVSDRGEPLFGLMFDAADREGVAIAPRQTVRTFERTEPQAIPALQLRTFMHELLHALNRRHHDAAQMHDGRLTLEAPTRCIIRRENNQWYLVEQPLLALSPSTIRFFQTAAARDILPGNANTPFEGLHASANECDDARANTYDSLSHSRWEFAKQRLFTWIGVGSARAQEVDIPEEHVADTAEASAPRISLLVQAQDAPYPLGYPIAIRLLAQNLSEEPIAIKDRIAPSYGLVQVEYRFKGTEQWQAFKPLVWYEPVNDDSTMLEPGGVTEQTAPIYFGDAGWTFETAGEYEVRATLHPGDQAQQVFSNVIAVRVASPQNEEEAAALQAIQDEVALSPDVGRVLIFGGRIGNEESRAPLEQVIAQQPSSALASAFKLTLASQHLNPPIDPTTGSRPSPSIAEAAALLHEMCDESGLVALEHELLARYSDELPKAFAQSVPSPAIAWDGRAPDGQPLATYSQPSLERLDASVHFCSKQTGIQPALRANVARLAQDVKNASPTRVIVVGHSDIQGTCAGSEGVALQRAAAVKQTLRAAGIPEKIIQTASLGKRRPMSFTRDEASHLLNRRVEILIEREPDNRSTLDIDDGTLLPQCN